MSEEIYSEVKQFRKLHIQDVANNHFKLNELHDEILKLVLKLSSQQIYQKLGPPPSPYSFFVMGSAGRFEQSVWSDQDHGIIYEDCNDEAKAYFLALGREISVGLYEAGYPYCDGGVMASNPLWCKSILEWKQQLTKWILESSWESIRHLLIFLDARPIAGPDIYVDTLKEHVYQTDNKEQLITKILHNTLHLKKGINVFGKLLTETYGQHAGALNLKEIGFFPYINAVRLLTIKENILPTSTLSRLEGIPETLTSSIDKELYKQQFLKLLNYRLSFGDHSDYDSGHFLSVNLLSKEQRKDLKEIIKNGHTLFHTVRKLLEKEGFYGKE